ncbi:MAG: 3-deoxy-7-phosphoheptulonate synthase [Bdellovibrionales bacterium]|nr:3-deoxy-7-phosphoheptulonate synthase [Bdellovibrionales bacterium]
MKTNNSGFFQQSHQPFVIIAGPCSIENEKQIDQIQKVLLEENISLMRGGIYKMRTCPDSFQGLGKEAIDLIQNLKKKRSLKFVSEVTDPRQIETLFSVVDIFQVGTRNMFNYELLKELGKYSKPVLLKRAFSARVKEWLLAAEYVIQGGNNKIILCERGIRTFETGTRNTLDLSGALLAQRESTFPVMVDPSHGTGEASLVMPMAFAVAAAGLDGLLLEIHPEPYKALSDGSQSLNFSQFKQMMKQLKKILYVIGKPIGNEFTYEDSFNEPATTGNKADIQLHSS